jgi:type I restriction enzyme S subunit
MEVGSSAYETGGIPFIRVSDISENGFEKTEKHISKELYDELKDSFSPKKGEVLFTKDGTIGRSFVVQKDEEAILSGAFLKLRIKPDANVKPDYLALVLNSMICKLQIERLSGGAIIAHLRPDDAMAMTIPILGEDVQSVICQMIEESRTQRAESKRLLDVAKRAVEIAIEQDDDIAFQFIEKETS